MLQYLNNIRPGINWAEVARLSGLPRTMFSKHFNGHQSISPKNYGRIFRATVQITGAAIYNDRIWWIDDAGTLCWQSPHDDNAGIMDAHDLYLYLCE